MRRARQPARNLLHMGITAGILGVVGGVTGVHWLAAAGSIALLLILLVLPWMQSSGASRNSERERNAR